MKTLQEIYEQDAGGKFPFQAEKAGNMQFDKYDFFGRAPNGYFMSGDGGAIDSWTPDSKNWRFCKPKPKLKKIVLKAWVEETLDTIYRELWCQNKPIIGEWLPSLDENGKQFERVVYMEEK